MTHRVNPEKGRKSFAGEDEHNNNGARLGFEVMEGGSGSGYEELKIEEKWLIDPKLLYLGPKIGEGGHAKVYEGLYKTSSVAVKILQPSANAEESAKRKERFAREVTMLCHVQHENLVKFIGACKESNMVLVTELLLGGSLRKYLRELRPRCLDLQLSISFALDIARAMECLHENRIIHRDLKPDNMLLTGDQKKVKLADFGLARVETLTEMMTAETGTYRWMAPELCSTVTLRRGDKKHYDHKVDVYSFSMVLWELLTNRTPFEGMSNLQAAYAAAFKKARPSVENLPRDLGALLECCWAEDPGSRPEFRQIIQMLSNYLASLPSSMQTTPPPLVEVRQSNYIPTDSPGTRHLMDTSRESGSLDMKPNQSSHGFLSCFDECFS